MSKAEAITDHDASRKWAKVRGGRPSVVESTQGKGGEGVLRFDFGEKEDAFKEISWDEVFKVFERSKLARLEQAETKSGAESRFFKFVKR